MSRDVADEKTSGLLVQSCGTTQKAWQERTKRGQRDQAASVFHEEFSGEIGVASLDASVGVANGKFAEYVVVMDAPARRVEFRAHGSQGIQQFQQTNVFMPLPLHDGQGIVGSSGVDCEMLFGGRATRNQQPSKKQEDADRNCAASPSANRLPASSARKSLF